MNEEYRNIKTIKDVKNVYVNIFPIFFKTKKEIGIFSMCAYRILKKDKNDYDKYLKLNDDLFNVKTLFKRGIGISIGKYIYYFNIYTSKIDVDKVINYPPQNLCTIIFKGNKEIELPMVYNAIYYKYYFGKVGRL